MQIKHKWSNALLISNTLWLSKFISASSPNVYTYIYVWYIHHFPSIFWKKYINNVWYRSRIWICVMMCIIYGECVTVAVYVLLYEFLSKWKKRFFWCHSSIMFDFLFLQICCCFFFAIIYVRMYTYILILLFIYNFYILYHTIFAIGKISFYLAKCIFSCFLYMGILLAVG